VPEELYNIHNIAIPRDNSPRTDVNMAMLVTITGVNVVTKLLKEEYSKNTEGWNREIWMWPIEPR
ncbi:hypothetical protein BGZ92_003833, partial [Podila epicladia]